jgi:hypothetical protein
MMRSVILPDFESVSVDAENGALGHPQCGLSVVRELERVTGMFMGLR